MMFSEARMSELIKIKDDYGSKAIALLYNMGNEKDGDDGPRLQRNAHAYFVVILFGEPLALSPERVEEGKENESKKDKAWYPKMLLYNVHSHTTCYKYLVKTQAKSKLHITIIINFCNHHRRHHHHRHLK